MKTTVKVLAFQCIVMTLLAARTFSQSGWIWQNPLPQGNNLYGVSMIDASTTVAVTEGGTILRTTDGGGTWMIQATGITHWLGAIFFADASVGTAVGESGTILHTTNG